MHIANITGEELGAALGEITGLPVYESLVDYRWGTDVTTQVRAWRAEANRALELAVRRGVVLLDGGKKIERRHRPASTKRAITAKHVQSMNRGLWRACKVPKLHLSIDSPSHYAVGMPNISSGMPIDVIKGRDQVKRTASTAVTRTNAGRAVLRDVFAHPDVVAMWDVSETIRCTDGWEVGVAMRALFSADRLAELCREYGQPIDPYYTDVVVVESTSFLIVDQDGDDEDQQWRTE